MTHNDEYALFNNTPVGAYTRLPFSLMGRDEDAYVRLMYKNEGVGYTQADLDEMDDDENAEPEGTRILSYVYRDADDVYHTLTYYGDIVYYDYPYEEYTTRSYWDAVDHDPLVANDVYADTIWCADPQMAEPLDIRNIVHLLITDEEYAPYYETVYHTFIEEAVRNTITDLQITEALSATLLERIHNHIKEVYI